MAIKQMKCRALYTEHPIEWMVVGILTAKVARLMLASRFVVKTAHDESVSLNSVNAELSAGFAADRAVCPS